VLINLQSTPARAMPKSATRTRSAVQRHVFGLDVAMDDAAGMGVVQRARDFTRDPHRLIDVELHLVSKAIAQRAALDVRHHVPDSAVLGAGVEQGEDGGVVESRGAWISRRKRSGPRTAASSG
jgi:hypothetical protein